MNRPSPARRRHHHRWNRRLLCRRSPCRMSLCRRKPCHLSLCLQSPHRQSLPRNLPRPRMTTSNKLRGVHGRFPSLRQGSRCHSVCKRGVRAAALCFGARHAAEGVTRRRQCSGVDRRGTKAGGLSLRCERNAAQRGAAPCRERQEAASPRPRTRYFHPLRPSACAYAVAVANRAGGMCRPWVTGAWLRESAPVRAVRSGGRRDCWSVPGRSCRPPPCRAAPCRIPRSRSRASRGRGRRCPCG